MGNSLRLYGSVAKPESYLHIWGRRQIGKVTSLSSWNLRVRSPSSSPILLSKRGNNCSASKKVAGAYTKGWVHTPSGRGYSSKGSFAGRSRGAGSSPAISIKHRPEHDTKPLLLSGAWDCMGWLPLWQRGIQTGSIPVCSTKCGCLEGSPTVKRQRTFIVKSIARV